jgi:hypothetical protein
MKLDAGRKRLTGFAHWVVNVSLTSTSLLTGLHEVKLITHLHLGREK